MAAVTGRGRRRLRAGRAGSSPPGAARIRLSLRSKMPPIPGTPPPESLRAARRLMTDSTRSETIATAASGAAMSAACSGAHRGGEARARPSHATSAPTPIATDDAAHGALPGLLRAVMRRHRVAPEGEPRQERARRRRTSRRRRPRGRGPAGPRAGSASPGDRRHDAHEVLQEQRDVDQAEEGGGERLDALLRRRSERMRMQKTIVARARSGWAGRPKRASVHGASVIRPPKSRPEPGKGALPAAAISR